MQSLSWRWAFLINVPILLAVLVAALARLAPMPGAAGTRLRLPTAVVATLGIGLLCFGLTRLHEGPAEPWPWLALAASAVVLTLLVRHQNRADDPLLPVSLLRVRAYAWAGFGLLLAATLMLGTLYLASDHLQNTRGLSPLETGLALLPLCLGSLVAAIAIPCLVDRVGMARVHLSGVVVQLAAILAIVAATSEGDTAVLIAALGVFGLGLPTMFVPLYTAGSTPIPPERAGVGSGLLNTFNEAGAAVGLAVVAPVAAASGTHAGFLALAVVALLAGVTAIALGRTET
ncbi:MFS transporter [Nocardiopsis sp. N85]|uniref:MFS transporter n=1 Tax=Nocardiopsis sp. N85 TaxID=3029400 RepID=UPI00237EEAAA|nr:MFS transporter [Nocardiopsis sp. N85]MDE3723974.1 MFS transporter [Nocardiopsis sp. N85]